MIGKLVDWDVITLFGSDEGEEEKKPHQVKKMKEIQANRLLRKVCCLQVKTH